MDKNPNLPTTPDPALPDMQTALNAFTAAVSAKNQGGKQATKARDAAREALVVLVQLRFALYCGKRRGKREMPP